MERLQFLVDVGLDYLTLARGSTTLSGGESQRIRLASQIGSGLTGVLYVLDEPSIGLHQRDNERLLGTLRRLKALGNTVLVVEHDEDAIRAADHLIDMGPAAGMAGGHIIASGTPGEVAAASGVDHRRLPVRPAADRHPGQARGPTTTRNAAARGGRPGQQPPERDRGDPARDVHVRDRRVRRRQEHAGGGHAVQGRVPAADGIGRGRPRRTTGWTGWSSSTRSSTSTSRRSAARPAPTRRPTPTCSPPSATGSPNCRRPGHGATNPAGSAFNVKGGRCEACQGDGVLKIEMHFLPDVFVTCDTCKGAPLQSRDSGGKIRFRGKSISRRYSTMTVDEAQPLFLRAVNRINDRLSILQQRRARLHQAWVSNRPRCRAARRSG